MKTTSHASIAGARLMLELHELERTSTEQSIVPFLPTIWGADADAARQLDALIQSATTMRQVFVIVQQLKDAGATIEETRARWRAIEAARGA